MISKILNPIYIALLIKSTGKRNFSELGRLIKKSGVEVSRKLDDFSQTLCQLEKIAKITFAKKKKLEVAIDESLLQKLYSKLIQGVGYFYNTKTGRVCPGFKGVFAVITDGKITIPISLELLFDKKVCDFVPETLADITKRIIEWASKTFPDKELTFVLDGSYSAKEMLEWFIANKIRVTVRMHNNRTVSLTKPSKNKNKKKTKKIKGKKKSKKKLTPLTECKKLKLTRRMMSRTILVWWHGMPVYVTAYKRIDKKGNESIIYLASTYKDKPSNHVKKYQRRWNIEKMFRTCKQSLGLKDCQSTNLQKQLSHMASVLLAYAFLQIEMKKYRLKSPEEALRRLKTKDVGNLIKHLDASNRIFEGVYA